jgi:hypothetical protein
MSRNVHVVPNDGGWNVLVEGSGRSKSYSTQSEAIRAGRELARSNRADHVIPGATVGYASAIAMGEIPFLLGARAVPTALLN